MTITAKIYQPAKSATQSGRAATQDWILEYETKTPRRPESLMGWVSSGDTLGEVRMHFASKEAAVNFARSHGFAFDAPEPQERKVKPRSYLDNFKYVAAEE